MAGMFYSLEEAAKKLNKTPEELKQIVKEGKLREFRDGPNLLFKVEEVEALLPVAKIAEPEEIPEAEPEASSEEIPSLESLEPDFDTELEAEAEPEPEAEVEPEAEAEPETVELEAAEPEMKSPSEEDLDLDEILLAPETGTPVIDSDLTNADTALTGQGTSVLGQTDRDYEITDDTMADTVVPPGTSSEVPLEEIEEDVNLDSFGSGSGLLDLSLQADDTSLGGILDEIYTAEGEDQEVGEAGADSAVPMPEEAEQIMPEEALVATQPSQEMPIMAAAPMIERAPDKQSNILGMMLFIPMAVVIYTIVVIIAGMKSIMPSILGSIQDFIWYIMAAAIVVSGLIAGVSFMIGGERKTSPKPAKAKKEKKPKKEKVKKEKPKKEKKPKKPKKPKKSK